MVTMVSKLFTVGQKRPKGIAGLWCSVPSMFSDKIKCVVHLYRYYEFDDAVIRELLGKKLSSRHRKDLDEVSEKTSLLLKSCRFAIILNYFKV
jgi:hypothetical protein